jgi:hypothetical protein
MAVTLLMTPPLVPVLGAAAAGVVRKAEQRSGAREKRREKGRGGGGRGGRGSLMPDTWRASTSRQAEMQRREGIFFAGKEGGLRGVGSSAAGSALPLAVCGR